MESNESALPPLNGRFLPSAPHTGQTRFRVSGVPTRLGMAPIFAFPNGETLLTTYCGPSPARTRPGCLDPFALHQAFLSSLVRRYPHDYYGSAAPTVTLAICPPTRLIAGAIAGSGVARTAIYPSAVGALP